MNEPVFESAITFFGVAVVALQEAIRDKTSKRLYIESMSVSY